MANESVDIGELFRFFAKQKKRLLTSLLIMLGFGLVVILLTRNHYSSTLKFVAQNNSSSGGIMRQLGGLSGLNLGDFNSQETGNISPQLYQEIIYSYPFLWRLSKKSIEIEGQKQKLGLFVEENRRPSIPSLIKKYTIGLPNVLFGEEPPQINLDSEIKDSLVFAQRELIPMFNEYRKLILLTEDPKNGSISIETQTVSPEVSAQVSAHVFELLSEYVTEYKTEKAKQNLEFIQERFLEAQSKFYDTQKSLSNFRDRNQNLNFSSARAQEERLLAEYNLASNLYNNLAIQLDQAKIKVQEDIPQLTIINPPVVSYQVSKPNIPLILALSVFLGVIIAFVRILLAYFKSQFDSAK
ncbi:MULTISPECIES: hypothetical protein [unclassified Algoriphagus]|jgi:uncharacterized protein involved in exopolysaccharide biosynthesis|uniref:hypothetical protein n=1 Tax=unclassified Algoriphagus TaxID=2641541 RepID=UPI000C5F3C6E|nr:MULTISPECIES: hypothetical protein [unclassified Algoriphagus]MAL14068.1 hypothetical protein [Algoriphagus sp.]HAD51470.1 hypothetical protein [Algoriphagus sp.]HAS58166.1 hypothetical protein [Algoriphagus sp.]HCH45795.1 hypothetical protein [Algoriphagus sp.]|tara:strand:+ start:1169 stop:2230 length:1062 start_codon:yes stop_codon:yes gene_type:complete